MQVCSNLDISYIYLAANWMAARMMMMDAWEFFVKFFFFGFLLVHD